jgi:hypothetical protein
MVSLIFKLIVYFRHCHLLNHRRARSSLLLPIFYEAKMGSLKTESFSLFFYTCINGTNCSSVEYLKTKQVLFFSFGSLNVTLIVMGIRRARPAYNSMFLYKNSVLFVVFRQKVCSPPPWKKVCGRLCSSCTC